MDINTAAELLVDTDITRNISARKRVEPVELSAIAAGVGGFVINGRSAADKIGVSVSAAGDVRFAASQYRASWTMGAVSVLLAALIPGLGAYWIHGWSQRILGASRVAMSLYLAPLYAGLSAWGVPEAAVSANRFCPLGSKPAGLMKVAN